MSLAEKIFNRIDAFAWARAGVLLGVSGGADSIALFRCFTEIRKKIVPDEFHFALAHVNHNLRGSESDADADFVRKLAEEFSVPIFECRIETSGSEEDSRKKRYDFLRQTAETHAFRYLALAHHAEDRAETVLHRIIRGTGISGLIGIPKYRRLGEYVTIMRPLLGVRRAEILEFLDSIGQNYRTDSSNFENRYTRNRIRNRLLPELARDYNPNVTESLLRLSVQALEVRDVLEEIIETAFECSVSQKSDGSIELVRKPLLKSKRYIIREVFVKIWHEKQWPLQGMGVAQWELLADAVLSPEEHCRFELPGGIRLDARSEILLLYQVSGGADVIRK